MSKEDPSSHSARSFGIDVLNRLQGIQTKAQNFDVPVSVPPEFLPDGLLVVALQPSFMSFRGLNYVDLFYVIEKPKSFPVMTINDFPVTVISLKALPSLYSPEPRSVFSMTASGEIAAFDHPEPDNIGELIPKVPLTGDLFPVRTFDIRPNGELGVTNEAPTNAAENQGHPLSVNEYELLGMGLNVTDMILDQIIAERL